MRLIRPSLVFAVLALMTAASCTLITDVDRTEIPEKGSDGSGGTADGGTGGGGSGGGGTGGDGSGGSAGENAGGEGGEAGAN